MFEGNNNLNKTISWKEWVSLGNRPKIIIKSMSFEAEIRAKMQNSKV